MNEIGTKLKSVTRSTFNKFITFSAKTSLKSNIHRVISLLLLLAIILPISIPVPLRALAVASKQNLSGNTLQYAQEKASNLFDVTNPLSSQNSISNKFVNSADKLSSINSEEETASKNVHNVSEFNTMTLENKVARIEIEDVVQKTIKVGDIINLTAIPFDKKGTPVHRLIPKWSSSNAQIINITADREATALASGTALLTAIAGGKQSSVRIKVLPNPKDTLNEGNATDSGSRLNSVSSNRTLNANSVSKLKFRKAMNHNLINNLKFMNRAGMDVEDPNTWYYTDPANDVGTPQGRTEPGASTPPSAIAGHETPGSANFSFAVPLISLPGRGEDLALALNYNSRVWNKSTFRSGQSLVSQLDYNPSNGGFNLGFGQLLAPSFLSDSENCPFKWSFNASVISPDGTRHELHRITPETENNYVYRSNDSSITLRPGSNNGYIVTFANGTEVLYPKIITGESVVDYIVGSPIKITDRNGNYLSITYKIYTFQYGSTTITYYTDQISTIQDTLGRYIRFHYDGNIRVTPYSPGSPYSTIEYPSLVSITAPGFEGGPDRQIARFYYQTYNLSLNFQLFATVFYNNRYYSNDPTDPAYATSVAVKGLKYIYFPGTDAGYRYDYSTYGSISKINQLRGMSVDYLGLDRSGTVTNDGQIAAWTHYNYPETASNLPDAPVYTKRTDDWVGRTSAESMPNGDAPYFTFANDETQGFTSVIAPDGTITESYTIINPPNPSHGCSFPVCHSIPAVCDVTPWNHGLVRDVIIKKNNNIISHTHTEWEAGVPPSTPGNIYYMNRSSTNPRPKWVEITNEAGQKRRITYSYQSYNSNNITQVVEHDFSNPDGSPGVVLRRTITEYETRADWVNRGLTDLPTKIQVFEGNSNTPLSRIDYKYDTDTPGATLLPRPGIIMHTSVNDYRGNVTSIIKYANAANGTGAITDTVKYDVAGNPVELTADCCRQKVIDYSAAYQYAYPTQVTRGSSSQLSTSATYDFNTGLVKTSTDENGQTVNITYNANSLRLTKTQRPDGGWTEIEYQDQQLPNFVKTTTKLDAARTVSSWEWTNGRGHAYRNRTQTPEGYLSSDVSFDIMGRPARNSNPYTVTNLNDPIPGNVKWTEVTERDDLGRTLAVKLPDDTIVRTSYNGMITTSTDQAGKKRRSVMDALGRVVRVDEPNGSGQLDSGGVPAQPTHYEYDGLDNLIKVTQTGGSATQERRFKYDSLSRLIYQKQVEAVPTINDGEGNLWTERYQYNSHGLLSQTTDARGVSTNFAYDGLNRIETITYSGETGYATPAITYTYGTSVANYNKGRLIKLETASSSNAPSTSHNYEYNLMGQVTKQTQTFGALGTINAQSYVMEYRYNLAGTLIGQKYPSGNEITYSYDSAGRLSGVGDIQRTYAHSFQYGLQGNLSQVILGNGTTESLSFNDRLQLTSQSVVKNDAVIQRFDYAYGEINPTTGVVDASKNNGQIAKVEMFVGGISSSPIKQNQQRFVYDSIGRLKQAVEYRGDNLQQVYQQTFSYDRFGNRYMKQSENQNPVLPFTVVEDSDVDKATNRFSSATNIVYDNLGNITNDNKFRNQSYWYDANGRMIKSQYNMGGLESNSVYDGLGQRVAQKVNGSWRYVIYDIAGHVIAEYGLPSQENNSVQYVHHDVQGSTRAVTNANGLIVTRHDYTAFGGEIYAGVGQGRTPQAGYSASSIRQKYALTERDDPTGLDHTLWRKLDASAGRWTSPDPYTGSMSIGDPQSFNRYAYTGNDPVNRIDPSGLFFIGLMMNSSIAFSVMNDYDWGWEEQMEDIVLPPEVVTVTDEEDPLLEHERAILAVIEDLNLRSINEGEVSPNVEDPDPVKIERLIKDCVEVIKHAPSRLLHAIMNNNMSLQPHLLISAHAATESGFLPGAIGREGELGLLQLKLSTANSLGRGTYTEKQVLRPDINIELGTTHLQNLINNFYGDVQKALAAYKQGEKGVRRDGLTKASKEYVAGILGCVERLSK